MKEFTEIFRQATGGIEEEYFQLAIQDGDPIYRERVYCYELYHQLRKAWLPPDRTPFRVNGEVDKRGHPVLKELEMRLPSPDLLIHGPGDMNFNYAVIEVKPQSAKPEGIEKDLRTLTEFLQVAKYTRAIYLFYGWDVGASMPDKVRAMARAAKSDGRIELWTHTSPGKPAEAVGTLS